MFRASEFVLIEYFLGFSRASQALFGHTNKANVIAMIEIVQFVALLLTALSMGVHFGTWLTETPLRRTQSGALFIEVHEGRDRVVARVMPILGSTALIFLALGVFLVRAVPAVFALSLA